MPTTYTPRNSKEKKFIELCEQQGLRWYAYSGRGMMGRQCPAVTVDSPTDTPMKGLCYDNMGKRYVVYTG